MATSASCRLRVVRTRRLPTAGLLSNDGRPASLAHLAMSLSEAFAVHVDMDFLTARAEDIAVDAATVAAFASLVAAIRHSRVRTIVLRQWGTDVRCELHFGRSARFRERSLRDRLNGVTGATYRPLGSGSAAILYLDADRAPAPVLTRRERPVT